MQWFNDLKISTKLISSFIVVLLLTAGMGIFSIAKVAAVNEKTAAIKDNWMPSMRAAQTARYYATAYRVREARHILEQDVGKMASIDSEISDVANEMDKWLKTY